MNENRRRSAWSRPTAERSAGFMVAIRYRLFGSRNGPLEYGSVTSWSRYSSRYSNSPNTRGRLPRLISSMTRTCGSEGCFAARSANAIKSPGSTGYVTSLRPLDSTDRGRMPSTNSS